MWQNEAFQPRLHDLCQSLQALVQCGAGADTCLGAFFAMLGLCCSDRLDSEAIVEYVKALVVVAEEELQPVNHPRVFSLAKIVEISHFNMARIRSAAGPHPCPHMRCLLVMAGLYCHANSGGQKFLPMKRWMTHKMHVTDNCGMSAAHAAFHLLLASRY